MEHEFIDRSDHPMYPLFRELYAISFPVFEQRTGAQQEKAFSSEGYRLAAYREEGRFVGFISCWEFPSYMYIEHFAIDRTIRGKGYGSRILSRFVEEAGKTVLLEIDPVADEVSQARLRFYLRCGFHRNDYPHIHPPYRPGFGGHPLEILTSGREITKTECDLFRHDLAVRIMAGPEFTRGRKPL